MDDLTEDRLIYFLKSHKKAHTIHLTWYGGEPLIEFKRIRRIYNTKASRYKGTGAGGNEKDRLTK